VSFVVGELVFQSKKSAREYFQTILNRHTPGQTIDNPIDVWSLHCLLARHPQYEQKVGCGVASFYVGQGLWGTRCFYLKRTDGTTTDFSYKTALDGKEMAPVAQIKRAMRFEVGDDIQAAKVKWFAENGDDEGRAVCAINGSQFTIEESAADHMEPYTFNVIADMFLWHLTVVPEVVVQPNEDNLLGCRFADRGIDTAWVKCHHRFAVLRIVSTAGHRSLRQTRPVGIKLDAAE
jgi:hypothetical protein